MAQGIDWLAGKFELLYRQWGAIEGSGVEELHDEF